MDNFPKDEYKEVFYISTDHHCVNVVDRDSAQNKKIWCEFLSEMLYAYSFEGGIEGFYSVCLNNKIIPIGNVPKLEKTGDHQTDYQINSKDLLNIVDEDLDQHIIKNVKKENDSTGYPLQILNTIDLIVHTNIENDKHLWSYKFLDAKQHLTDLIKNITDHGYDEEVRSLTVWVCGINAEENREKIIYGHYESDYLLYSLDDEDDIPKMQLNEENNWSEDWESSDLYFLKNIQLLDTLNSKFWKTQPTPWKKFLKDN